MKRWSTTMIVCWYCQGFSTCDKLSSKQPLGRIPWHLLRMCFNVIGYWLAEWQGKMVTTKKNSVTWLSCGSLIRTSKMHIKCYKWIYYFFKFVSNIYILVCGKGTLKKIGFSYILCRSQNTGFIENIKHDNN